MKFGKETSEEYCKFDVELSNKEWAMLKDYGLKLIQNDEGALINYAFNKILEKQAKEEKNAGKNTQQARAKN
jgi:hypothetical protein